MQQFVCKLQTSPNLIPEWRKTERSGVFRKAPTCQESGWLKATGHSWILEVLKSKVRDPAGQALERLPQKLARGRPKNQKLPAASTGPASFVDHAAQYLKEFRHPLDFLQNHEPVRLNAEIEFRLGQFRTIRGGLQIQIDRQLLPRDCYR